MNKYIVKPIVEVTAVEYVRKWGVYDNSNVDPDGRHCINDDPNLNLVVWVNEEWIANQICSLLNEDEMLSELNK